MKNKKILIITSGGDAPGMNIIVKSIGELCFKNDFDFYVGIGGYKGLYLNRIQKINNLKEIFDDNWNPRDPGTLIKTSRFNKLDPTTKETQKIVQNINEHKIDFLIVVGGDGSFEGAKILSSMGVKVVFVPSSIDGDLKPPIGSYSAAEGIARLLKKVENPHMINGQVYEIMGRDSAFLVEMVETKIKEKRLFTRKKRYLVTNKTPIEQLQDPQEFIKKNKIDPKKPSMILMQEKFFEKQFSKEHKENWIIEIYKYLNEDYEYDKEDPYMTFKRPLVIDFSYFQRSQDISEWETYLMRDCIKFIFEYIKTNKINEEFIFSNFKQYILSYKQSKERGNEKN